MNKLKNDPVHQPPILPGFNQQSCRQGKASGTNRTPVKPACDGEHQLKADSAICSTALVMEAQGYSMHKKRKLIFGKHTEIRKFRCHNTDPPGAPERIDTTDFRRQGHCLAFCHKKTGDIALNKRICSFTNRDGPERIYLSKTSPVPCMAVNGHSGSIASKPTDIQIGRKMPFRWRNNSQLKWLEKSACPCVNCAEPGSEIYSRCDKN